MSQFGCLCGMGSDSIWWGEATDEPAREDARPTEVSNLDHYHSMATVDILSHHDKLVQ